MEFIVRDIRLINVVDFHEFLHLLLTPRTLFHVDAQYISSEIFFFSISGMIVYEKQARLELENMKTLSSLCLLHLAN